MAGNLSVTATGAISQTAALSAGGTSNFNAGANAITLTNAGNSFTGAVTLSNSGANNVALQTSAALQLAALECRFGHAHHHGPAARSVRAVLSSKRRAPASPASRPAPAHSY
ncbi:MAG: hypothetical protein WDO24_06735 [Pseudomonadota bacterium]